MNNTNHSEENGNLSGGFSEAPMRTETSTRVTFLSFDSKIPGFRGAKKLRVTALRDNFRFAVPQ